MKENSPFRKIDVSLQKVSGRKDRERKRESERVRKGGGEGKKERGRNSDGKKEREEGAEQSYYKNPQNNRRGSH